MSRTSHHPKQENFNFRVSSDLKTAFQKVTELQDKPAAQVIRDFMRAYIDEHQKKERGYDAWLISKVQESLDDTRPAMAHETIMQKMIAEVDGLLKKEDKN